MFVMEEKFKHISLYIGTNFWSSLSFFVNFHVRVIDISASESRNCLLHLLSLVIWQSSRRVELSGSFYHGKSSFLAGPVFLRTFVFIRLFRVWFIFVLIFAFHTKQHLLHHNSYGRALMVRPTPLSIVFRYRFLK